MSYSMVVSECCWTALRILSNSFISLVILCVYLLSFEARLWDFARILFSDCSVQKHRAVMHERQLGHTAPLLLMSSLDDLLHSSCATWPELCTVVVADHCSTDTKPYCGQLRSHVCEIGQPCQWLPILANPQSHLFSCTNTSDCCFTTAVATCFKRFIVHFFIVECKNVGLFAWTMMHRQLGHC